MTSRSYQSKTEHQKEHELMALDKLMGSTIMSYPNLATAQAAGASDFKVGSRLYIGNVAVGSGSIEVILIPDLSDTVTANSNAVKLQTVLLGKGSVTITAPGSYYIGNGQLADGNASIYIPSDTKLKLGLGVIIKQSVAAKSLFINSNWKSNRVNIVSVGYVAGTPVTGGFLQVVNTGAVDHGLEIGDYAYIKNDTNDQINGIFKVTNINKSDVLNITFTVSRHGKNTGMLAFAGVPIVYKANANISVYGDGLIDYQAKGSSGLLAMGSIFNKIKNLSWNINTMDSVKYGIYVGNCINFEGHAKNANCGSNPIQFIGPASNIVINGISGEATDDPFAITTNNAGYSSYDTLDADGSKNCDGDVVGVFIRNINVSVNSTRLVLLGASSSGNIKNVYIDTLSNYVNAKTPLLLCGVATGESGSIENLHIDSINAICTSESFTPITLVEGGTGTLAIKNAYIGSLKVTTPIGSLGLRSSAIKIGEKASSVNLVVSSMSLRVDLDGTSNLAGVECLGVNGGHVIQVDNINVAATGTTRSFNAILLLQSGAPSAVQIGNFYGKGSGYIGGVNSSGIDGDIIQIDNFMHSCAGGVCIASSKKIASIQIGNYKGISGSETGLLNLYPSLSSQILVSVASLMGKSGSIGANAQLKISIAGGVSTQQFSIAAGGTIRAVGNISSNGATYDGASQIDAIINNHAEGSSFYNNNALFGTGVGLYTRGATAWVKVA